jgi:hypothetical protein
MYDVYFKDTDLKDDKKMYASDTFSKEAASPDDARASFLDSSNGKDTFRTEPEKVPNSSIRNTKAGANSKSLVTPNKYVQRLIARKSL